MRTHRDAHQAKAGQTDRGAHAAHLPIAAFLDGQFQPGFRHALAEPYRRIARPQPIGRLFEQACGGRLGRSVIQHHTDAQLGQMGFIGNAFDLHQIGFRPFEFRRRNLCNAGAVIGQQQQAFGIDVEPAGGIHILRQPEPGQRRPRWHALVGELRQHAVGLVESD